MLVRLKIDIFIQEKITKENKLQHWCNIFFDFELA